MSVSLDSISLTSPGDALALLRTWLRTERQRVNWTQQELARRSGVPAASISRLERTGLATTDALTHDYAAKEELFRRATLNVLEHNRDDHLKNFAFLMDEQGRWSLAPFYDFTYSEGPNGWQTLSVAGEGANPTQADLDRLAREIGLKPL